MSLVFPINTDNFVAKRWNYAVFKELPVACEVDTAYIGDFMLAISALSL